MNNELVPINDLNLVVLLGDPRFDNPYHGSETQKEHDQNYVAQLREAMNRLVDEKQITYLDKPPAFAGRSAPM